MRDPSQEGNNSYYTNESSLKGQTIREDGAQSHGSLQGSLTAAKMAGLPAPKEES